MVQMHAFYVFLGAAGLLTAAFLYVALSTRNARDISAQSAYGLRKKLFFVVLVVLLLGIGMTLGKRTEDDRLGARPHLLRVSEGSHQRPPSWLAISCDQERQDSALEGLQQFLHGRAIR